VSEEKVDKLKLEEFKEKLLNEIKSGINKCEENELRCIKVRILLLTWLGCLEDTHRRHRNDLRTTPTIEAYIQSQVLRTTLEAISFEKRRGIVDGYARDDEIYKEVERLGQ
jgi:hypothetical protein